MAVKGVHDLSLSQVPNLDRCIVRCRNQKLPVRVERYRVDSLGVSVVVLEETLRANVEDLNLLVAGGRGQARPVRVELDTGEHSCVIVELIDYLFSAQIPELDATIVTARGHHARVEGKSE